jgi:hypothetical protein
LRLSPRPPRPGAPSPVPRVVWPCGVTVGRSGVSRR